GRTGLSRNAEVRGSSPLDSTSSRPWPEWPWAGLIFCRLRLLALTRADWHARDTQGRTGLFMFLFMFCEVIAMVGSMRRRPKGVPQLLKHKVRGKTYAYALFDGVRHSYGACDADARRLFAEDFEVWKANGCRWPDEPGTSRQEAGESKCQDVAGLV